MSCLDKIISSYLSDYISQLFKSHISTFYLQNYPNDATLTLPGMVSLQCSFHAILCLELFQYKS